MGAMIRHREVSRLFGARGHMIGTGLGVVSLIPVMAVTEQAHQTPGHEAAPDA